ncbi:hypothetical protein GH754_05220 [Salinibacillus xinjiangensis]|uniref:Oxidoreductase FAD/NAD(P)-binding domain-containing protein n=1 Tax=Salinibacillus xinjiangensis TaxID=1229268 RepID=A0A6G1X446_9BACI|nr:hypothetical protein [Salinibacillus xinjiangensis]
MHAARSGKFHALKEQAEEINEQNNQVHKFFVYENPEPEDEGVYDHKGYITEEWLSSILRTNDAAFFFCGPKGIMHAIYQSLNHQGVKETDIHFEIFGPMTDIKN